MQGVEFLNVAQRGFCYGIIALFVLISVIAFIWAGQTPEAAETIAYVWVISIISFIAIAVIYVIAIVGRARRRREDRPSVICPHCGGPNTWYKKVCAHCGMSLKGKKT